MDVLSIDLAAEALSNVES